MYVYRLKALDIFDGPEQVNTAIQDVAAMLSVPRHALGISCASRQAHSFLLHMARIVPRSANWLE